MDDELIQLSEEIFTDIITQLTLHLRFMDIALTRFILVPDSFSFRCDGRYLHYSPVAVIKMYRNDAKKLTRGYFHIVLHAVFSHQYFAQDRKMSLWDLACDLAVENVILELDLPIMRQESDEEKRRQITALKKDVTAFTAQNLYHLLEQKEKDRIKLLRDLFVFDEHECWYELRNVSGSHETLFGDEVKDDKANAGNNRFDKASHDTGERSDSTQPDADDAEIELIRNALKDWKEISEKIEADLELFKERHGGVPDALVQSLKALHREKYSYRQFLSRFMRTGEKLHISDEDFDTIFYTYGLQLYKNLPLIEPLEYREESSVRELVIAIDTSGSVQGDTVQAFLNRTYNIFCEKENFFSRFRIHIVQCDMEIREAAVITSQQQFNAYIKNLEIKGLGGTDFRPVFAYADEQVKAGAFRDLGGILYFTDGDGVYPKTRPSYPAAFLLPDNRKDITVPPWAIRYILEEEDLHAYQAG